MAAGMWCVHGRRAKAHYAVGDYDQALADLRKAVEFTPSDLTSIDPDVAATCPDDSFRMGLLDLADKSIVLSDHAADAYATRGLILAAFGKDEQALSDCETVKKLDGEPIVWYRCALIQLKVLQQDAYQATCADMIDQFLEEVSPDDAFWIVWTCLLNSQAADDYAPLVRTAQRAVKSDPNSCQVLHQTP